MRKYGKVPGAGVGWVTSSRPQVPCGNMTKSQGQGGWPAGGARSRAGLWQSPRGLGVTSFSQSKLAGGDQFRAKLCRAADAVIVSWGA